MGYRAIFRPTCDLIIILSGIVKNTSISLKYEVLIKWLCGKIEAFEAFLRSLQSYSSFNIKWMVCCLYCHCENILKVFKEIN